MANERPLYVGIDLGTTNTAAAVFDGEQVELVRSSDGSTLTPSVVRIDGRGRVTVGHRARRLLDQDPDNTRAEFKRLMGTGKPIHFPAMPTDRRPEELSAEVLKSVRDDVREQLGVVPERAVISVPALFELPQTTATSDAARLAGFERVELIQEPVASAIAAGWSADDEGGPWLVYDLGGGTFDVSLLETREGLLRVVGHDGDNFLGGRDIDAAIVAWALESLASQGVVIDRADPAHAGALRVLRTTAEEAKIELTRRPETELSRAGLFQIDGRPVDVELVLNRSELERRMSPVVDRSIAVCARLLARYGITPDQLRRVVLVGGPTVSPFLRERVGHALRAPFAEGLDPMTLVARGAALFAGTANLDARPIVHPTGPGRRLWLQYPAMSSDLTPFVAGRLLDGEGPAPREVRFVRDDGVATDWVALGTDGGLVAMLELAPRRANHFSLEARDAGGAVPVLPERITLVQGRTIADPPLSRSVGVALADDLARTYLERGTSLPAKRTFVHHTVQGLVKGDASTFLTIPVVQGEHLEAHLCRLVGTLTLGGTALRGPLPAGSAVEVTIEVDRGGRLSARALIPSLDQVFEHVAQLVVPDADPETLDAQRATLQERLLVARQRVAADAIWLDRLVDVEWWLQDATALIVSARGGDDDAAQKARRLLLDADAGIADAEEALAWPELEARSTRLLTFAARWTSEFGSEQEQRMLAEAGIAADRARVARKPADLQRQLDIVRELAHASYFRHPKAWQWEFESAAADVSRARDLVRAEQLVADGRHAAAAGDRSRLRGLVHALWDLLPGRETIPGGGYGSGIR